MSSPSRFPNGLSLFGANALLGNLPVPPQVYMHKYENDFDTYLAGDWTVTATTGSSALVAGNGGLLTQTTAAAGADIQHNLKLPAAFTFVPGTAMWFAINLNRGDNANDLLFGLQAGGTAFAPTSGVYFTVATAQNLVNAVINNAGTSTTIAGITSLVPTVPTTIGFYYDGRATPTLWFFSSATPGSGAAFGQYKPLGGVMVASAGGPSPVNSLANLPVAVLSPGFGIRATPASAKTLTTDFLVAGSEMLRG